MSYVATEANTHESACYLNFDAAHVIDDFQKIVAFGDENNCDSFCTLMRNLSKYNRELLGQILGNKALYKLVFDFYQSWQLEGIESALADICALR